MERFFRPAYYCKELVTGITQFRINQTSRVYMKKFILIICYLSSIMLPGCGSNNSDNNGAFVEQVEQTEAKRFGTYCQEDFQNNWLNRLPSSWNRCKRFNDQLSKTDYKVFYHTLHDAKPYLENIGDYLGADSVDLLYLNTHGSAWEDNAVWQMWNQDTRSESSKMRLGDDSTRLSLLASFACKTHMIDNRTWVRWESIFRGGLRWTGGSHGTFWSYRTTEDTGADFAANLQIGVPLSTAWDDANTDWMLSNDRAVLATGADEADCYMRRDLMNWQNFKNYPRLRDNQVQYWCSWRWSGLDPEDTD
jgi:hypothetical protein